MGYDKTNDRYIVTDGGGQVPNEKLIVRSNTDGSVGITLIPVLQVQLIHINLMRNRVKHDIVMKMFTFS